MLFVLNKPALLLAIVLAALVSAVLGSLATVLVARALGDPMGQRSGRLTVNPVKHLNVYSAICVLLAGVGWAEPVPLNDRWRARRFHVTAAVLARPVTYALLCLAALGGVRALSRPVLDVNTGMRVAEVGNGTFPAQLLSAMSLFFAFWCVTALIPTPPTDLGRVIFTLGGRSYGWQKARYQLEDRNFGLAIVMALLLLPVLFNGFPSWTAQLGPELWSGLAQAVGLGSVLT